MIRYIQRIGKMNSISASRNIIDSFFHKIVQSMFTRIVFLQARCAEENHKENSLLLHMAGRIKSLFKILALKSLADFARAFSPRDKHKLHFYVNRS